MGYSPKFLVGILYLLNWNVYMIVIIYFGSFFEITRFFLGSSD